MARDSKVDSKSYYNTLPPMGHECGDIWRGLPSFGLLGDAPCAGIVITPACDLSWQKSDTLTYLPIVPVTAFFSLDAALPSVIERTVAGVAASGLDQNLKWSPLTYVPPSDSELVTLSNRIAEYAVQQQRSAKAISAIERVLAGIKIIHAIKAPTCEPITPKLLFTLFGSEWAKTREKIVKNSYSPALHFLPRDNQDLLFSGIIDHSVVLFRCPITVPVKMLSYAEETSTDMWQARIVTLGVSSAIQTAFCTAHPIKLSSLRAAYLSDMLTRFSALYNRVGSPDFSPETVDTYISELDS